jgi:hypothetical protein
MECNVDGLCFMLLYTAEEEAANLAEVQRSAENVDTDDSK